MTRQSFQIQIKTRGSIGGGLKLELRNPNRQIESGTRADALIKQFKSKYLLDVLAGEDPFRKTDTYASSHQLMERVIDLQNYDESEEMKEKIYDRILFFFQIRNGLNANGIVHQLLNENPNAEFVVMNDRRYSIEIIKKRAQTESRLQQTLLLEAQIGKLYIF